MPRLLFYRDFVEYTGGHGKVWDYFRHAQALGWDVQVYFTQRSLRDSRNPWMQQPKVITPRWQPEACDVLFLAGLDWLALPDRQSPPRPVINLLQHVRHAWPQLPLRNFLSAPAHRICVSRAVADAVRETGEVNGPLSIIPAALDVPQALARSENDNSGRSVLIAGLKAPVLAQTLADALAHEGVAVDLLLAWVPREEYLARVARAAVAVTLPHPQEGFYLPALEAMALGVPVVMGDCIGSREYARANENCLMPEMQPEALVAAVNEALQPARASALLEQGRRTAQAFGQMREREAFAGVLLRVYAGEGE